MINQALFYGIPDDEGLSARTEPPTSTYYTTYYSVTVPLMRVADVKAKYKARACFHYTDHLYASINKIFATYFIT